jgi:hypothetical protein
MAAKDATVVNLLTNSSAANTAGATGTGVLVAEYEGDLLITQVVGAITGTLDGKLQACSAADGTGAEDITGAVFTQVTTSNDNPNLQTYVLSSNVMPAAKPYLRYIGTVDTGPSVVGVTMHARKKYLTGGD